MNVVITLYLGHIHLAGVMRTKRGVAVFLFRHFRLFYAVFFSVQSGSLRILDSLFLAWRIMSRKIFRFSQVFPGTEQDSEYRRRGRYVAYHKQPSRGERHNYLETRLPSGAVGRSSYFNAECYFATVLDSKNPSFTGNCVTCMKIIAFNGNSDLATVGGSNSNRIRVQFMLGR